MHRTQTTKKQSGFTLIELLVVIAIIAILAAILFPVFAQAREKARQASCLSNEKQLGLGITMYIQDYDESFPISSWWEWDGSWFNTPSNWVNRVMPYMKSYGIVVCPSDAAKFPSDISNQYQLLSYAANGLIATDQAGYTPRGVIEPFNPGWLTYGTPTPMAAITYPSQTIMVAEKFATDVTAAHHWSEVNVTYWPLDMILSSSKTEYPGMDVETNNCGAAPNGARSADSTTANFCNGQGKNGAVSNHHNKMSNFLFTDGHVKAMDPVRTNPDGINQPQNNLWDARRR